MNTQKSYRVALVGISILWLAGVDAPIVFGQSGKVVSSYYTDNNMHNLKAERFYKQELANGMMMAHDGAIKTFPQDLTAFLRAL